MDLKLPVLRESGSDNLESFFFYEVNKDQESRFLGFADVVIAWYVMLSANP